jgi:hypothetical protein
MHDTTFPEDTSKELETARKTGRSSGEKLEKQFITFNAI